MLKTETEFLLELHSFFLGFIFLWVLFLMCLSVQYFMLKFYFCFICMLEVTQASVDDIREQMVLSVHCVHALNSEFDSSVNIEPWG